MCFAMSRTGFEADCSRANSCERHATAPGTGASARESDTSGRETGASAYESGASAYVSGASGCESNGEGFITHIFNLNTRFLV